MRKLGLGAWRHPRDPSVHVQLDIDITQTMEELKQRPKVKLNHVVIYWFSKLLYDVPSLNRAIIGNTFKQRLRQRIFIPTVFRHNGMLDLNGVVLDNVHTLSLEAIADTLKQKVQLIFNYIYDKFKARIKAK